MELCKKCGARPNKIGKCLICEMLGQGEPPGGTATTGWPMVSEALAVHPSQVQQANDRAKRHGLHTVYRPDGMAVIPSRNERKRLLRLESMHDNCGGYGD